MGTSLWKLHVYKDAAGNCPVEEFLSLQGDAKVRALIIRKMQHVGQMRAVDQRRPLVDTVDGPIKELRVDKQVRVLFTQEREAEVLLFLVAERKKNGKLDEKLIEAAKQYREDWLENENRFKVLPGAA